MKVKTKKVYYCEYCGRHRLTSYSIKEHEKYCTLNPQRTCRMCECSNLAPVLEKYRDLIHVTERQSEFENGI